VQVAVDFPLLAARVHVADGLKVPVLLVVKDMVPVGVVGLNDVSVTLAVQIVAALTRTEPGEQAMVVVVGLSVGGAATLNGSHGLVEPE
jgi:hypothetical protein